MCEFTDEAHLMATVFTGVQVFVAKPASAPAVLCTVFTSQCVAKMACVIAIPYQFVALMAPVCVLFTHESLAHITQSW